MVVRFLFFEHSLAVWNGIKRFWLRLFGAQLGVGVVIKPQVKIKYPWKLRVGNHCWIGEQVWIDVFEAGERLTRDDLAERLREQQGMELAERHLATASTRQILARMLGNLEGIASREQDAPAMLRYLDAMLTVDSSAAARVVI